MVMLVVVMLNLIQNDTNPDCLSNWVLEVQSRGEKSQTGHPEQAHQVWVQSMVPVYILGINGHF